MTRIAAITAFGILFIFVAPILSLLVTGDFTGPTRFYGLEEDSALVDSVLSFREIFTK